MDDALKKKLLLKEGRTLRVFNAPKGSDFESTTKNSADVVLAFVANKKDVDALAEKAIGAGSENGAVWFCYPKKTGAIKTDISRDVGWESLNARGWHPVTLVAIDLTWSALRFKHAPELAKERSARAAARETAKKSAGSRAPEATRKSLRLGIRK